MHREVFFIFEFHFQTMINFNVVILGNGSAVPTSNANPSSQLISYENKQFLVDCGEGTQMQLLKFKIRYHQLEHIFISHLHGDHFYGLIGMISTFHLFKREKPLHIYAARNLESIINDLLHVSSTTLKYPLLFHPLENQSDGLIYEDESLDVRAFLLKHRMPTWGFRFTEKERLPKINKDFVEEYHPDVEAIKSIKSGKDYMTRSGEVLENERITLAPPKPRSYAYCSDTAFFPEMIPHIIGVDLLYHEASFGNDLMEVAHDKYHSTAAEAAQIAKQCGAAQLLLGHFSARYKDTSVLLNQAKEIFEDTMLSKEGNTYPIG